MAPDRRPDDNRWPGRSIALLLLLLLIGAGAAGLRLCLGYQFGWPTDKGIRLLRLDNVISAVIVGVALASSGVGLQAMLRNPLAEPFILGLSTGAGLGIFAQKLIELKLQLAPSPTHLGALCGALASMAIVFTASRRRGVIDPLGLLLTGVVLGTVAGALIMFLNYMMGPAGIKEDIGRWMMGYFNDNLSMWPEISVIALITAAGLGVLLWCARAMNAATFSDAEAISMGVNLSRLRVVLFMTCSVLAAGAVVLAGPIAFVGLISPHIARLMLGPSHRSLLVGSALVGATTLLLADSAAQLVNNVYQTGLIPIGVFTALLGGPMFLWMLHPRLGRGA